MATHEDIDELLKRTHCLTGRHDWESPIDLYRLLFWKVEKRICKNCPKCEYWLERAVVSIMCALHLHEWHVNGEELTLDCDGMWRQAVCLRCKKEKSHRVKA